MALAPTRPCTPVEGDSSDSAEDGPLYVTTPARNYRSFLPPEILLKIFFYLSAGNICEIKGSTWHWIYVTHVCQFWRNTAISCTNLWSFINISSASDTPPSPRLVHIFLNRSKEANLAVKCFITGEHNIEVERCLEAVYTQIKRIRELEIGSITSYNINRFLRVLKLMCNPAPKLEKANFWYRPTSMQPCYLPDTIFGTVVEDETTGNLERQPSALKSVTLQNYCIDWRTTLLSGLTELVLRNSEASSARFTIGTVLHILGNCPKLKRFVASMVKMDNRAVLQNNAINATANRGSENAGYGKVALIELPNLQWIEILETNYEVCERLMSRLILPPDVCWNFDMDSYPSLKVSGDLLRSLSLPELLRYDQAPCKSLSIVIGSDTVYLKGSLRADVNWNDKKVDRCLTFRVGRSWGADVLSLLRQHFQSKIGVPTSNTKSVPTTARLSKSDIIINVFRTILTSSNWNRHITSLDLEISSSRDAAPKVCLDTYRRLFESLPVLRRIGVEVGDEFKFDDVKCHEKEWIRSLIDVLKEKSIDKNRVYY